MKPVCVIGVGEVARDHVGRDLTEACVRKYTKQNKQRKGEISTACVLVSVNRRLAFRSLHPAGGVSIHWPCLQP